MELTQEKTKLCDKDEAQIWGRLFETGAFLSSSLFGFSYLRRVIQPQVIRSIDDRAIEWHLNHG